MSTNLEPRSLEPSSVIEVPPRVGSGTPGQSTPSVARLLVRLVIGLLLIVGGVAVLGQLFRAELTALGQQFVARFGLTGMLFGTIIADGLHFPVPPQFYMLMGITSGVSAFATLLVINIGSFLGAWFAFLVATRVSVVTPVARRLEQARALTERTLRNYGSWAIVVVSLLPITYAALCYLCGLTRVSKRQFALVTALRVPRLLAYYYLVKLGWV
ncbi:MAG TPA: VTT domain-containing protein [Polyangiaceae bacterium]|nr:VTT domain-containing protein [Polyangiaceae bacterium]